MESAFRVAHNVGELAVTQKAMPDFAVKSGRLAQSLTGVRVRTDDTNGSAKLIPDNSHGLNEIGIVCNNYRYFVLPAVPIMDKVCCQIDVRTLLNGIDNIGISGQGGKRTCDPVG